MRISIQPLIDLLLYHRQGDNGLFKKLVEQWLAFSAESGRIKLDTSKAAYEIKSNLSLLGFIDIYKNGDIQKWSSIGASVVDFSENGYILFLSQYQLNKILDKDIQKLTLFSIKAKGAHYLDLTISHSREIINIKGVPCITPEFENLIDLLPVISNAIDDESICRKISELSVDMALERYDFKVDNWLVAEEITSRSLYRQRPIYGPYRYFIVDKYHEGKLYELLDKEWIYILAHELLNQNIPIKYNVASKQAKVVPRHFFRLPSLLQRILNSGALEFPKFREGYLVLEKVDKARLIRLGHKMNSLRILLQ